MDAFQELERLELVAKIVAELDNHLGTSDRTLAEYIIERHKNAKTFDDFQTEFQASGLPDSLIQSIDRVIKALTSSSNAAPPSPKERKAFSGLAMPDSNTDDLMAELELSAPKASSNRRYERDNRYYDRRSRNDRCV